MTITLQIPEATPSQNKYHYSHWSKARDDKKRWSSRLFAQLVCLCAKERNTLQFYWATGKRKLTVSRHGKKKLDPSNLIGGIKGIIDCLVEMKLLVDDDDDHLELSANNAKLPKGVSPFTVLTLEDL